MTPSHQELGGSSQAARLSGACNGYQRWRLIETVAVAGGNRQDFVRADGPIASLGIAFD
jgi:hypothetical protein